MNTSTRRTLIGALLLAAALLVALGLMGAAGGTVHVAARSTALRPPPTPEPLVPTSLPSFRMTATPQAVTPAATTVARTARMTATPQAVTPVATTVAGTARVTATPQAVTPVATTVARTASIDVQAPSGSDRARVGAALAWGKFSDYDWGQAAPGWYLSWRVDPKPEQMAGVHFAQMVRVNGSGFYPEIGTIRSTARTNPGSLWLIGNEPDVKWQDNATPEQYAATYGLLHAAIKEVDSTAQIAIGGVSQPTPLRLAYLDRVLAAYRAQFGVEMPVDAWNTHAFILREERGSWGVDIPPGMDVDRGQLFEIADHNNMDIFRRQIIDFRRWMAQRGLQDKPLIVTEYSILMPASYGFPPDVVADFMVDTFDFFLTARDPELGYPADDNRLVQAFNWFSVGDTVYPTSNLFDPETRQITLLGEAFKAYVSALR